MTDEVKKNEQQPAETPAETPATDAPATEATAEKAAPAEKTTGRGRGRGRGGDKKGGPKQQRGRGRRRRGNKDKRDDEFESKIIDLARVTRVMAGGKRMSFRAAVLVADGKGKVAMGIKKGADVQLAVAKATNYAKKRFISVPLVDGTIPHTVEARYKGARVLLKPAKDGTGIIAGGAVRLALEMVGVQNVVAKIMGSPNKINNLHAVMEALGSLRTKEEIAAIKKAD